MAEYSEHRTHYDDPFIMVAYDSATPISTSPWYRLGYEQPSERSGNQPRWDLRSYADREGGNRAPKLRCVYDPCRWMNGGRGDTNMKPRTDPVGYRGKPHSNIALAVVRQGSPQSTIFSLATRGNHMNNQTGPIRVSKRVRHPKMCPCCAVPVTLSSSSVSSSSSSLPPSPVIELNPAEESNSEQQWSDLPLAPPSSTEMTQDPLYVESNSEQQWSDQPLAPPSSSELTQEPLFVESNSEQQWSDQPLVPPPLSVSWDPLASSSRMTLEQPPQSPSVDMESFGTQQTIQLDSSRELRVVLEPIDASQYDIQTIRLSRREARTFILHHYDMGDSVSDTLLALNSTYGQTVTRRTVMMWYKRFVTDRNCADRPRKGRPKAIDNTATLLADVKQNSQQSTRSMAQKYNCSAATVMRSLHQLNYVARRMGYHPHKLDPVNLEKRVKLAKRLLRQSQRDQGMFENLVTCDESKIPMFAPYRGIHWIEKGTMAKTIAKDRMNRKWNMLCVFWNRRGIIHWELLDKGVSINRKVYQKQLKKVAGILGVSKHRPVPLLHDNAPCHRARETIDKAKSLGFNILNHPPYSPDISPSDYHLFRSLSNKLRNKHFKTKDEMSVFLKEFFESKPPTFYARGIDSLPARWKRVIKHGGKYCF